MLRQGMMGSDMSDEDMLEVADFDDKYEAEVIGEDETAGRPCWKLEARARDDSVSYPRRLIWIDKQNMMPLRQELFAASGMMPKTWIMSEIEMVSARPVARRMEISDQLKERQNWLEGRRPRLESKAREGGLRGTCVRPLRVNHSVH